MRGLRSAALAMALAGLTPLTATAQEMPQMLPYNGFLADSDGLPVDGTINLSVRIYTTADAPNPIWQETLQNVPVEAGYFRVDLGRIVPLAAEVTAGRTRFLGLSVNGDAEATPRQAIGAVPYALLAGDAALLGGQPPQAFVSVDRLAQEIIDRGLVTRIEVERIVDQAPGGGLDADAVNGLIDARGYLGAAAIEALIAGHGYLDADAVNALIDARGYLSADAIRALIEDLLVGAGGVDAAAVAAQIAAQLEDRGYLDADAVNALIDARGYVTGAAVEALIDARGYLGEAAILALINGQIDARGYLREAAINALIDARGYLSEAAINALIDARNYLNAAAVNALIDARNYLNAAAVNALIDARNYLNAAGVDALIDARNYLNANGVNALIDARNYISRADAEALVAAAAAAAQAQINALENTVNQLQNTVNQLQNTVNQIQAQAVGAPYILGRSAQTSTGRFSFNGVNGLRAAHSMCQASFANEPTAHLCSYDEVQRALSTNSYNADNAFDGVNTWTTAALERGAFAGTKANTCQSLLYNSGDVATGTQLRVRLNELSGGGGGGVRGHTFEVLAQRNCSNNLPVLCCR